MATEMVPQPLPLQVLDGPMCKSMFRDFNDNTAELEYRLSRLEKDPQDHEERDYFTRFLGETIMTLTEFVFGLQWVFVGPWTSLLPDDHRELLKELMIKLRNMAEHPLVADNRKPYLKYIVDWFESIYVHIR